jgi:hypothetical protein
LLDLPTKALYAKPKRVKIKVKNITSQAYALKYPNQFILGLTEKEFSILGYILYYISRYGNGITIDQTELAFRKLGCTPKTVNRAFSKFRQLGLIITKRRFDQSSYVSITNFFSFPRIRAVLSRYFRFYPVFKITISLLLSEYVSFIGKKTSGTDPAPERLFRTGLNRSSGNVRPQKRGEKVNEVTVRKILDIERALLARGETLETMDANKLAAFPEECLDAVSVKMRGAHPKKPFAFFMHLCMAWCKENNQEAVFEKADALRQLGVLNKMRVSRPAGIKQQLKEQPKQYSEQVRQDMQREKLAAEARTRRFTPVQLVDEIAGMKKHVEELTARVAKGERGMSVALMIAQGALARREYELSISTEVKDVAKSYTNTAPQSPIVLPKSNLFSYEEGEESEEDIPD